MCRVDGCDKPKDYERTLCHEHYLELRRTQYYNYQPVPVKVCHCGGDHHAKGLCRVHYLEQYRRSKGIVPRVPAAPKPPRKPRQPRAKQPAKTAVPRKKEVVGYRGAHIRVQLAKGKAKDHHCQYTDCLKSAQEWALDPLAVHTYEDEQGRVWSMNVNDYSALCSHHHRLIDNKPDDWYIDLWLENK